LHGYNFSGVKLPGFLQAGKQQLHDLCKQEDELDINLYVETIECF
jgi:hypothetical protein